MAVDIKNYSKGGFLVGVSEREIVDLVLSSFDADSHLKELNENFSRKLLEGIKSSGVPLESAVSTMAAVPVKYKRVKVRDPNIEFSSDDGIFTPSGLVDHIALAHHAGFNLFDLLNDGTGYTALQLGGEKLYFVLMRNAQLNGMPEQDKKKFQYRLAIWNGDGELVGFRNHYVMDFSLSRWANGLVVGGLERINIDFSGASKELGLVFGYGAGDGLWVSPTHRRRNIGTALETIATSFIPSEVLGIDKVLVYPGTGEAKNFYWQFGYDDDVSGTDGWVYSSKRSMPKVNILPLRSDDPTRSELKLNPHYSLSWQYAKALNANPKK